MIELASYPHVLAREAYALLELSDAAGALALVARGEQGPRCVVARGWTETQAVAAAAQPAERLRIALSTVSASTAGLYVAQESGVFERHGLDVELVNLGSGQPAQAALLTGEVAVIVASGASTVNAILAGDSSLPM